MKKNFLHFYILVTVLFSDYLLFAQSEPGDTSDPSEDPLEGEDAPAAPINSKLIILAITGVLFALYVYRRRKQTA